MVEMPMTAKLVSFALFALFIVASSGSHLHIIASRLSSPTPASTNISSTPFFTLIPAEAAFSIPTTFGEKFQKSFRAPTSKSTFLLRPGWEIRKTRVGKLTNSCPEISGIRNGFVLQYISSVASIACKETVDVEAGRLRGGGGSAVMVAILELYTEKYCK
jgi:hypothetical protein